ncbi:MAG: 23S rRNA (pseudouridine(1915)-N(3))-methyltransferase RlmH [Flavobacteriales bacterium]|nr:23S rRNA (pseudouridine(1915)-N(3))-methyltransferase RlmH [Flavobacteriales bacterium]MBK6551463.1 23S rRNA (pseudouridine(1915)-N(3))-methyltransferase RlmH [Flavobacteriales bacterium]MBK6882862.1 23S rRNA (pseudouridine(1915)-N(3))-methyltransferase RlmH [Flavobacteriales bacterium]MBK7101855.1 23S rRNA (pseudouridine(1915)-N(3))-methyltransferase RlmH [Flavobacteriales bacterium]MBK7114203.1 23S rRNA (pseudouridine(1915)-N(3))-methyltransferase RlmH [Flavobacteriales bacterium]
MKVRLLLVGRSERGWVTEGLEHYVGRLGRMFPVELVVLPEAGKGQASYQQRVESERILAALKPGERVVVLDERGKALTSPAFAQQLGTWRDQGVRQVAFVIGGAYGMTDAVRDRADLVLALSAMIFPHQLVRVLFAEQLYRAATILQGSPYHH